jgi:hypothetical protein
LRALKVAVEFLRVVLRERREEDHIERLEAVGSVRGEDGEEDAIAVAKIYEISRYMAAMAVKDEKPVAAARFLLRIALEHLFKPGQSYVIVAPS